MDLTFVLTMLAICFFVAMILRLALSSKKQPEEEFLKLNVIVQCKSCKKKKVEEFKDGDYLLKPLGICRCSGKLRIVKIYADEKMMTAQERKWKAYEKRFEV